jgi:hypothetical protein
MPGSDRSLPAGRQRNRAALLDRLPARDLSPAPNGGKPPSTGAVLDQCLADFAGKAPLNNG